MYFFIPDSLVKEDLPSEEFSAKALGHCRDEISLAPTVPVGGNACSIPKLVEPLTDGAA